MFMFLFIALMFKMTSTNNLLFNLTIMAYISYVNQNENSCVVDWGVVVPL